MRLLVFGICLQTTACAAVSGFPEPILSERQEVEEMAAYLKASAITDFEACVDKVYCRNAIVDARLRAIDLAFYRFQRRIYRQDTQVGLGTDVASMALDSMAAFTNVGGLAAGAGLLTGGRDAFQKQAVSVSMPLLFDQMAAKRAEILLRIRQGQALPITSYSLFQALGDVSEYEHAGSIPAAASELGANAGLAARTAQLKLDALRAAALAPASASGVAVTASTTSTTSSSPGVTVSTTVTESASVPTAAVGPAASAP